MVAGLEGIITEVRIAGDSVLYLVGYFENGAYAEKWFIEAQFDVVESAGTLPIGVRS
jgi:hypothetical protein